MQAWTIQSRKDIYYTIVADEHRKTVKVIRDIDYKTKVEVATFYVDRMPRGWEFSRIVDLIDSFQKAEED